MVVYRPIELRFLKMYTITLDLPLFTFHHELAWSYATLGLELASRSKRYDGLSMADRTIWQASESEPGPATLLDGLSTTSLRHTRPHLPTRAIAISSGPRSPSASPGSTLPDPTLRERPVWFPYAAARHMRHRPTD